VQSAKKLISNSLLNTEAIFLTYCLPLRIIMSRYFIFHFFILTFAIYSFDLPAQPIQFRFQHLTNENGLAHNTVYDCVQDKYGFMWFSTRNGVCRYDGYNVKTFKPSDFFTEDVSDLSQCIELTTEGNIIFGTGSGMYMIDIEKDSITFSLSMLSVDSTDSHFANVVSLKDDGKNIWIGTGNGLVQYKKNKGELKRFKGQDIIQGLTKRFWIKALELDSKNNLWIASPGGLTKFNTSNFTSETFNENSTGKYFIGNSYFSSISIDGKNNLWAGSLKKGVFKINLSNYLIEHFPIVNIPDSSKEFNEIKRICADSKGFIWAGTQYTGLIRINATDNYTHAVRTSLQSKYALASDYISALYESKNGILWVGTYNSGVDRTNIEGSRFFNIPFAGTDSTCFNMKAVECFAEQDASNIWVGTMNGLFLFNRNTFQCKTFEEITNNKIKLPHNSVSSLIYSDSCLFICTRASEVYKVNIFDFSLQVLFPDTAGKLKGKSNSVFSALKTNDNKIYFGFDLSLQVYSTETERLKAIVDQDSLILNMKRIDRLTGDNKGNIFLSSGISTMHRYNSVSNTISRMKSYDANINTLSMVTLMHEMPNGDYIMSDYKGLHEMDENFNFLKNYSVKAGLCDNKINNSHVDAIGRVWLATYNGLSVFNPDNKRFANFYMQDGLADNEFRDGKSLQASDGTLFFPLSGGFTFFNPKTINNIIKPSSVFFTGIKIQGKEIKTTTNINNVSYIAIPSGSNYFTVSFASDGYNTLQPASYLYKLDGFDSDWIPSSSLNTASYTNLDGGSYIFKIKAAGSNSTERILNIEVANIFYKTWWFRILVFTALLFTIYRFLKFREKQRSRKESERTIDYFSNSFYGKNTVEEILWDVCRNCISRLGFEDAVVYLVDEKYNVLVQKAAYGPKNPKDFEIAQPLEIPVGQGIVGSVAKTGKAEIITDTTRDGRYIADDAKRLSEIAVPIVYKDKVIGVIDSENSKKHFFTKEHQRILTLIASICSSKIAKAQGDQQAVERERMLLEIGKKVAETRLMALRAQMNPHFIFNSLNSIQDCIVSEQHDKALNYLTQFSKLLRTVMDYSDKNYIPLEKEIEFLKLYLNIESLRFSDSFKYEIILAKNLDIEEINVPSLLIQPFAENAIWHGLMHKQGERTLNISFSETDDNNLEIIVEDNGIGRKKAEEIKAGKMNGISHESKGMKISEERIALLKLQTDIKPVVDVTDLTDDTGIPSGTRVKILIPVALTERKGND